jgi:chemosensory pili system protein ChpA (sensor histidine kinase/response regulator)
VNLAIDEDVPDDYVLVVDDDADIRETLELTLGMDGHEVVTAADGGQALRWLRSGRRLPCLILLDLMMPGMNGFELMTRLISDPGLAGIPVVVLTGAGVLVERRAEDLYIEVLRKPLELAALLATVRRFCGPAKSH